MSALHLVTPRHGKLTIEELLALLGPDQFTHIEATARRMREEFNCPQTVRDFEGFKDTIFSYYVLYQKTFFNASITNYDHYWREFAYQFAQQHLTRYNPSLKQHHARDLHEEERNAITGRHGGMISVIDAFTEAIITLHRETHFSAVFFDHIAPSDYETRLRLAQEFLKKYGGLLFPGESLLPHYMIAMNLEEVIKRFVMLQQEQRRDWEY